jgi:hypothetical protein
MTGPVSNGQRQKLRGPATDRGAKRGRRQTQIESTIAAIDRLLLNPVGVTVNGERATVPALHAIMLHLLQRGMTGDARARRVLLKYLQFASQSVRSRLEITFLDSGYTQSAAKWMSGPSDE